MRQNRDQRAFYLCFCVAKDRQEGFHGILAYRRLRKYIRTHWPAESFLRCMLNAGLNVSYELKMQAEFKAKREMECGEDSIEQARRLVGGRA